MPTDIEAAEITAAEITERIIDSFGGIRPMAAKIGAPPSTVKSWHKNQSIPRWWHKAIIDAAVDHRLPVSIDEVSTVRPDAQAAA